MCLLSAHQRRLTTTSSERITARALALRQNIWQQPLPSWKRDCHVGEKKAVTIVEVMGRNAGWLTAASALSRVNGGEGPSLIYLCEPAFDTEQFLKDVQENWNRRTVFWLQSARAFSDSEGRYVSEQVQRMQGSVRAQLHRRLRKSTRRAGA